MSKIETIEAYTQIVKEQVPEELDLAIVIANAGVSCRGTLLERSPLEVQEGVNVNMIHPVYLLKAVMARL